MLLAGGPAGRAETERGGAGLGDLGVRALCPQARFHVGACVIDKRATGAVVLSDERGERMWTRAATPTRTMSAGKPRHPPWRGGR